MQVPSKIGETQTKLTWKNETREWQMPLEMCIRDRAWIEAHPGVIGHLVFAVPRARFDAFDAAFGKPKVEEVAPVVAEEDEDEFDLASIELPEGVTLR